MNKITNVLAVLILLICIAPNTNAQSFLEKAAKRAKDKAKRKAEKKINGAIDNTIDGNNSNSSGRSNESNGSNSSNGRAKSYGSESNGNRNKKVEKATWGVYKCAEYIAEFPGKNSMLENEELQALDFGPSSVEYLKAHSNSDDPFYRGNGQVRINQYNKAISYLSSGKDKMFEALDDMYTAEGDDVDYKYKRLTEAVDNLKFAQSKTFPNNPDLAKVVGYAQKLQSKLGGVKTKALDNAGAGTFHKQNVNKIFFTNNLSLNPATATASDFKTSFKAGEKIKAVAYLNDTYKNIFGIYGDGPSYLIATKDEAQRRDFKVEGYSKDFFNKGYVEFILVTDAANYKPDPLKSVSYNMAFLAEKLPPREVALDVRLMGKGSEVKGKFSFDAGDDAGLAKMKEMAKAIRAKSISAAGVPKAGMRNSSIEKQCIALYNSQGWEEKFTKCVIASKQYTTLYHKVSGRAVGRSLRVFMFSKKPDGSCMYQDFTVAQEKTGSGYSKFRSFGTGSQADISCDKVR